MQHTKDEEQMKFKTKEELIKYNPYMTIEVEMTRIEKVYNRGVTNAFKSFKERVEFYEKYKASGLDWANSDGIKKLEKEYPQLNEKWKEHLQQYSGFYGLSREDFNDWLFDYCFGDIE